MDFLVNDLSLYGQYPEVQSFMAAMDCLMKMKGLIKRHGFELFCHRSVASTQITPTQTLSKIIHQFSRDKKQAIMSWLTQNGPFWEDLRMHGPDEYITYQDEIVTDSAVGEAAWCSLNGTERNLVSFSPSRWEHSPISVSIFDNDNDEICFDVLNFWKTQSLEIYLEQKPKKIDSWEQLKESVISLYPQLYFHEDAFNPLNGHPFVNGASQRLFALLKILDDFKSCHDEYGKRTKEGHELYKNFFTGKKGDGGKGSLFKDSSERDKSEFKDELTFSHPKNPTETLFCPWHGSTQTPQLRIHFSWPVKKDEPIYIMYVGPKITKR